MNFPRETELALLIDRFMRRIHFKLRANAAQFDVKSVGRNGGMTLLTIADTDRISLHDLTERMARDKSQMTRAIKALEQKGLVARETAPDDARVSLVFLTADGKEVVAQLRDALTKVIDEILEPISTADKAELKTLLNQALNR
ncbi:MAG: MarR family transcriptional regulator [Pseudomonadota bacterium]